MRSIIAIRRRFHSQISVPCPHSVRRCSSVSGLPHCQQNSVSTRCMATKRSFVGTMMCVTVCHADRPSSDTKEACRYRHNLSQSIVDFLWTTFISGVPLPVLVIYCSLEYSRLASFWFVSAAFGASMMVRSRTVLP